MKIQSFADTLAHVAAVIRTELPDMSVADIYFSVGSVTITALDAKSYAELIRGVCGRKEKHASGNSFWITCELDGIRFSFDPPSRETVCDKKVVGKRIAKKRVEVRPAEYAEVEVEEDIIEWDCGSVLDPK